MSVQANCEWKEFEWKERPVQFGMLSLAFQWNGKRDVHICITKRRKQ